MATTGIQEDRPLIWKKTELHLRLLPGYETCREPVMETRQGRDNLRRADQKRK